jgi:2'-5' RNA ligase
VRLFLGFPMPADAAPVLDGWLARMSATHPQLRWVAPGNLHLTARFLGEVDPGPASEVLRRIADSPPSRCSFRLETCGTFPRGDGLPGVYWLGGTFGQGVEEAAGALAFLADEKGRKERPGSFRPHVTVARQGRCGVRILLQPPPPVSGVFGELVLFNSRLTAEGPVYERIGAAELPRA